MQEKLDTSFVGHHVSAGGFVFCREGEKDFVVLLLNSKHEYMFPKGHLESGEDKLTAAKREIQEEVGIKSEDLVLINNSEKDCFEINYNFIDRNKFENTKDVFIFAFKVSEKIELKKEDNDDILEVAWYEVSEAKKLLSFNLESLDWAYATFAN